MRTYPVSNPDAWPNGVSRRLAMVVTAFILSVLPAPTTSAQVIGDVSPSVMAQQLEAAQPQTLYFVNANVLDATRSSLQEGVTVKVADGRIESITEDEPDISSDALRIDLGGRYYLIPGLIDAHNHVHTFDGMYRALQSGVTTMRTVGVYGYTDVILRDLIESGRFAGPEIFASGILVQPHIPVNSWLYYVGAPGPALKDPRLTEYINREVRSPEDLANVVKINLDRGADIIKVQATENAGQLDEDPRKQLYDEQQIRVIVATAAEGGAHVAAHAHGDEGVRAAVLAGVRSIEHGAYASDESLRLMAERGTYLTPTLAVARDLTGIGGDYDAVRLRIRGAHIFPALQDTARRAREAGVTVVTGTDTAHGEGSMVRIGQELAELVEVGYTPMEALSAATLNGAEMLGIDDRTGRIAEGFEADLVVIPANPLTATIQVQDPLVVVTDGRLVRNRFPFGVDE